MMWHAVVFIAVIDICWVQLNWCLQPAIKWILCALYVVLTKLVKRTMALGTEKSHSIIDCEENSKGIFFFEHDNQPRSMSSVLW